MFKELWNMPNVLWCGSFDPTKRAETLARAGELGAAAVRALTSEDVLDARTTSRSYRHSIHMKTLQ